MRLQRLDEARAEKRLAEGALWIGVDEQDLEPRLGVVTGQMEARRTLAAAPLSG